MFTHKNGVIMLLCVILLTTISVGCSSKPSEDVMKEIIIQLTSCRRCDNYIFDKFKIVNDYITNIKDGTLYIAEIKFEYKGINQKYSVEYSVSSRDERNNVRLFYFIKRGNRWYGREIY
jgi:hypothetical protein